MKWLLGIVVTALLGLSLWWSRDDNKPAVLQAPPVSVLQAYMKDFQMLAMDESGQPALQMTASSMKQYSDRKQAELENPQITLHDQRQQWHIVSEQGLIDRGQQTVSLQRKVVLKQRSADRQHKLEIHARSLQIDLDRQIAHSDKAVTIIINEAELHANGMVLDNRNGRLQLLADVRGVIHEQ